MTNAGMRIGQVAKRTGLDVRLIRHYENIGLIPPPRRSEAGYASAGYRIFTEEHVHRLEFIGLCRLLDLPLRQIGDLLRSVDDECCASAQPRLRRVLGEKLQEVDRRITLLQALHQRLESYLQRLPGGAESQETAGCAAITSPIRCAFGDTPEIDNVDEPAPEVTKPFDSPTVGNPKCNESQLVDKGVAKMCEVKSEVKSEVKADEELKVIQPQEREKARKDAAKSSGDCCEPLCNPITCGP